MSARHILVAAVIAAAAAFNGSAAAQVTYLWDADPMAVGAQDGSGVWSTDPLNLAWTDGTLFGASQPWPETVSGILEARFGIGTATDSYTVTVESVSVNDISFTGPGQYTLKGGAIHFAFPGLGGQNAVTVASGAKALINSTLDGSSTSGDIIFVGGGTLELGNANTFNSNDVLWLQDISLIVHSGQAFGNAVLELGGPSATLIAGEDNLVFTNEVRLGASATANVIEVGGTKTMTIGGKIKNGPNVGGFSKTGSGTLILKGENTYGGDTTVEEGTLHVAAEGAIDWSVTVEPGATLENHGFIYGPLTALGEVTGSGSFEAPAVFGDGSVLRIDETGNPRFNVGLTLEEGAKIHFTLGADPVTIQGDLNIEASEPIFLTISGTGAGMYEFIDFSGVTNLAQLPANAFALAPLPASLEGTTLKQSGSGYMLHVVPEPSTTGLLGLGLAFLSTRRRRRMSC